MLLITGATGNVGRALVSHLDAAGVTFRVLVRDTRRAAALPARVKRVVADLGEPATLKSAFDGVTGLFLLVPGTGLDHATHALAAAQAAGARHIVLLSSFNALGDPIPPMGRWHHAREELIRTSGIPFTFLRPSGYMTNALDWLPTIRQQGFVLDPTGPGRHAPIDPADIAAVAARVLTDNDHYGTEYVLTGSQALTVAEMVDILAHAIGRHLEARQTATPAEAVRFRYPNGAPQQLADAIIESLTHARADTVGLRTDTVEQLLGRKPTTFADWCARNASTFQ
jgi:uncharacterized protein YbjT (DUF2867 family)